MSRNSKAECFRAHVPGFAAIGAAVLFSACASAPATSPIAGTWVADGSGPVQAIIFRGSQDVWYEYAGTCRKGRYAFLPADSLALAEGPSNIGAARVRYSLRADTLVLESAEGITRFVRDDAYRPEFRHERCPSYPAEADSTG